jgi:hypothetical protein
MIRQAYSASGFPLCALFFRVDGSSFIQNRVSLAIVLGPSEKGMCQSCGRYDVQFHYWPSIVIIWTWWLKVNGVVFFILFFSVFWGVILLNPGRVLSQICLSYIG